MLSQHSCVETINANDFCSLVVLVSKKGLINLNQSTVQYHRVVNKLLKNTCRHTSGRVLYFDMLFISLTYYHGLVGCAKQNDFF